MNKKTLLLLLLTMSLQVTLWGQNSAKITKVIEYRPAPGQHINRLFPNADMSDTYEHALKFANDKLVGNKAMLGLGAFGGYVVVGFDHSIVNVEGEYDFKGLGNSFTGSSEPGIVMVCQDLNKNGKPDTDEPWYELAGSEYDNPQTMHNYEITYYRPEGKRQDVRWTDNQGNEGTVKHISYASQDYMYPNWLTENTITLKGTKLRNTAYDKNGGVGSPYWVLEAFDYGYIDNHANNSPIEKTGFKIDWAVDNNGNSVELNYIDFIRVHTAQVQEAGWLGETSTEVAGIEDLHPNAIVVAITNTQVADNIKIWSQNNTLRIEAGDNTIKNITLFSLTGKIIYSADNEFDISVGQFSKGAYLLRITLENSNQITKKIIL